MPHASEWMEPKAYSLLGESMRRHFGGPPLGDLPLKSLVVISSTSPSIRKVGWRQTGRSMTIKPISGNPPLLWLAPVIARRGARLVAALSHPTRLAIIVIAALHLRKRSRGAALQSSPLTLTELI